MMQETYEHCLVYSIGSQVLVSWMTKALYQAVELTHHQTAEQSKLLIC